MENSLPVHKKIILFDGVCNFCNDTINYIIKNDRKDVFRFASLQSILGQELLNTRGINPQQIDSIVLIDPDIAYYIKADAAIEIAVEIGGLWSFFRIFEYILPQKFRNFIYDFVAKNRYRWFGKKEQCMIPTPELKAKFLG